MTITNISVQRLIDLHMEHQAGVPSNREVLWGKLGRWQLDLLKSFGMERNHKLLDVGCGPLRLGMLAIPYLEENNYSGVDTWEPYLSLAKDVLLESKCKKSYSMIIDGDFNLTRFNKQFDFAIAQSVVTHLSLDKIHQMMKSLKEVMQKGGKFIFTYSLNKHAYGIFYEMEHPMIAPAGLNDVLFKKIAKEYDVTYLPLDSLAATHPTGQQVSMFEF